MADEIPKIPPKRAAIAMTAAMALLAIRPLMDMKEFIVGEQVVTNARIEATMKESFARLENKIDKHVEDEVTTHRRMHDLWDSQIAAAEGRCEKRSDKTEDRIQNLEVYAYKAVRHARGASTD